MRVTQSMMSTDLLRQMSNSYEKLSTYQSQIYTGKKITRPSQDPVVATLGIQYRSNLVHAEQYERNMSEVHKWFDSADASLGEANDVLQRVRELVVQASNGTNTPEERRGIQKEVSQLKQQLVTIGNKQVAGSYIFHGSQTQTAPLKIADGATEDAPKVVTNVFETTDYNPVKISISDGVSLKVNVDPEKVFGNGLFDTLTNLENDLQAGTDGKKIGSYLDDIDQHLESLNGTRADLGARMNRAEMLDNRLAASSQMSEQILSDNEDVDFEKALMNLQQQETVHRAALAVAARIMQPTLVDFLK